MLLRINNRWALPTHALDITSRGVADTKYVDNKQEWLDFIEKWEHLTLVAIHDLTFTEEQVSRFMEIQNMPEDKEEVYRNYVLSGNPMNQFPPNHPFNILTMAKKTHVYKTASEMYEQRKVEEDITTEELKQLRILKLKEECTASIYAGFLSGTNEFGYNEQDQGNFTKRMVTILAGALGPFQWKSKNNGVVELTKDQFIQAINDAETHQLAQQQKYWALETEALAAGTVEAVDAIVW